MKISFKFCLRWICFCYLISLSACTDISPSNPYDDRSPSTIQIPGSISGRVAHGETGTPLRNVKITLYDAQVENSTF